ncbi:hypothetical protein M408DRAFT_228604 [Serendipita vermifera MAFF 305830]|uniref:Uncharacterized protein n=1 Tax=Serendipita vermifera MAFF 305830 TaxID=933852 RepID=A0A0C3B053_SERVB|nr:hypothetical protein M408DRAFT_228604 [Serendipita vermifera MAFF 305830]
MVILFASYGSASRDLLPQSTPFRVQEEQLVGLTHGPKSPIRLLLTRAETAGLVKIKFSHHIFDDSLLDYVYDLTSGHVGAYCDTLEVIKKDEWYRALKIKGHEKYTYQDFILNFEMSTFLQKLSEHGVFSRGLPSRDDLGDPEKKYVESLCEVLQEPSRSLLIRANDDQHDSKNPLRRCLEKGWLFSERADGGMVKYRFASQLHELFTEWLLLRREYLIKDSTIQAFVLKVIEHFSPQNLQTRGDLSSSSTPQSIPEAQFQQEFYRACGIYTGNCVTTFPECGTAKGRIDFFIRSKKWGVEVLRDGHKLYDHSSRFTTGEYGKWIKTGKMDDYIMIDFRSEMPNQAVDINNLLYVVSTDNWNSVKIYDQNLNEIKSVHLLYH